MVRRMVVWRRPPTGAGTRYAGRSGILFSCANDCSAPESAAHRYEKNVEGRRRTYHEKRGLQTRTGKEEAITWMHPVSAIRRNAAGGNHAMHVGVS